MSNQIHQTINGKKMLTAIIFALYLVAGYGAIRSIESPEARLSIIQTEVANIDGHR